MTWLLKRPALCFMVGFIAAQILLQIAVRL